MTRRQFLKSLGLSLAATQVPIGWVDDYSHFDPEKQYGNYVLINDFINKELLTEVQQTFAEQIKHIIPPKYRGNISWIVWQGHTEGDFTFPSSIAWKYSPENNVEEYLPEDWKGEGVPSESAKYFKLYA